ncbi:hypothetical protein KAR28_04825 [Candidatus Parcubacteria bacterium]|nr:hypothetical protein [Candidatus Parcubacteria bacterium]
MKKSILILAIGAILFLFCMNVSAQSLDGYYDASSRWGSGWLDLRQPTTLEPGTCFRFTIGGTASKVLIRFLRVDDDPNRPVGIVGGIRNVPESREIIIKLSRRFPNTKQISVHGNPKSWHFDLGGTNGPAILESVEVVPCKSQ